MASRKKSPPSIRLVESAAAELRLVEARAFIHDRIARGPLWLVGPSRGSVDDLARSVARECGATIGLHRFSVTQLAARLAAASLADARLAPATYLGSEAVAARAVFETQRAGSLDYFGPVAATPGFPRALARTLQELRMAHVAATISPPFRSAVPTCRHSCKPSSSNSCRRPPPIARRSSRRRPLPFNPAAAQRTAGAAGRRVRIRGRLRFPPRPDPCISGRAHHRAVRRCPGASATRIDRRDRAGARSLRHHDRGRTRDRSHRAETKPVRAAGSRRPGSRPGT